MSDDFSKLKELCDNPQEPEIDKGTIGMLRVRSANDWMNEAASRPNPQPLWDCLWNEGEVCCLFADSNLGKSIYAVQIAKEIAESQKVIYYDFELSDKQFQLRYSDQDGNLYRFPDNFLRGEVDIDGYHGGDFEDEVMQAIEAQAEAQEVKVLIVDNLSWLCNQSEKGDSAGALMTNLITLKKRHGWSILVIAHTPKRALYNPITQNDLAGSKKLFNFFDAVFAIGQSAQDNNLRYIKQLKVRAGAFKYDCENVITCEICKDGAWLHFRTIGYGAERNHLKEPSDKDRESQANKAKELSAQGKSQREIASILGVSAMSVNRMLKK